jgi:hypothetical protein
MGFFNLGIEPIDMGEDLWWIFYLPRPMSIESRQLLLNALQGINTEMVAEELNDPDYTLILRQHGSYLEVLYSEESSPYLLLGMRGDEFLPVESPSARLNADRFLEFGKICYRLLKPIYAFAETVNSFVERNNVEAGLLTHMFWAQFFGPAFVQKIGQEILQKAPAWRNENMSDGGILFAMAATPYMVRGPQQYWLETKRYFDQHLSRPITWLNGMLDLREH